MRITMEQAAKLAVILTVTKKGHVHALCAKKLGNTLSSLKEGEAVREWVKPRTGYAKRCPNVEIAVAILNALGITLERGNDAPRGGNTGNFYCVKEVALIPDIGEIVEVVEHFAENVKKGRDAGDIAVKAAKDARPYLNMLPEKGATAFPWIPETCWK